MKAEYLKRADALKPTLSKRERRPASIVEIISDKAAFQGWKPRVLRSFAAQPTTALGIQDEVIFDFEAHSVGLMQVDVEGAGGVLESPLQIKLTFGEVPLEVVSNWDPHQGVLSRLWLQDELLVLDRLPQRIQLARRFAFRFLKIAVLMAPPGLRIKIRQVTLLETDALPDSLALETCASFPAWAQAIDLVSLRTLRNCMQTVFEDGPKRDRRLWLGDLRLQALTNQFSFQNYDLVKRCLYLFAGLAFEDKRLPACLYEMPEIQAGQEFILDYSVLFVDQLRDYSLATGDWEISEELWPLAVAQIDSALRHVSEVEVFRDPGKVWIFIDWCETLHKEASMHAILVFGIRRLIELGKKLGKDVAPYEVRMSAMIAAGRAEWFDSKSGCYASGPERQISWATQAWMILAGMVSPQEGRGLFEKLEKLGPSAVSPVSPYLYHHVVEALVTCEEYSRAVLILKNYWGGMIQHGATTFWEVYDPADHLRSPYGNACLNSYCHAWSCTPSYFLRRYLALAEMGS